MLPTLGLFKTISCPCFYQTAKKNSCLRPYCHFKHGKLDDSLIVTVVPQYTPKAKVTPQLLTISDSTIQSSSNAAICRQTHVERLGIDLSACFGELHELSDITNDKLGIATLKSNYNIARMKSKDEKQESTNQTSLEVDKICKKNHLTYTPQENSRHILVASSSKTSRKTHGVNPTEMLSTKNCYKTAKISIKDNNPRYMQSPNELCNTKQTAMSKQNLVSSTQLENNNLLMHKCKNKISKHRHPEKSLLGILGCNYKYKVSVNDIKKHKKKKKILASLETDEPFASTREDIMKECEIIYDQMEEEFATLYNSRNKLNNVSKSVSDPKKKHVETKNEMIGGSQKKRVAFENAIPLKNAELSMAKYKPYHMQAALKSVFYRREVFRREEEKRELVASLAFKDADQKLHEANEVLQKVKQNTVTPLAYLTSPPKTITRSIAPVTSMLALTKEKKKVDKLKAFSASHTTSKFCGRTAHKKTSASINAVPKRNPPVLEPTVTKISYNIRMQYYELMVKQCCFIYVNLPDAWERAQMEELAVLKKCNTPVIYKSSALLAINKLRKEAAETGKMLEARNKNQSLGAISAGKLAHNTSWSVKRKTNSLAADLFDKLPGDEVYNYVVELILTEEQLVLNGYPRAGNIPGCAIINNSKPRRRPNERERYCARCAKVFHLSMYDEAAVDMCNYHPKSTGYRRGFVDNHYICCQQPGNSAGCTYANYHVTDYIDFDKLTGYVTTLKKNENYVPSKKDIFAVDCEMCYTTAGVELTRVTVVDINSRTVYDTLVKPDNKIIDYNTKYSGITEQMFARDTRSLRDVQGILLSMFHSKTILIGHSLESDLNALKLIHSVVVDTSILFPHKLGPPKKRALKTLCVENLKRIIQENEDGHDSFEDAEVCIQLVKFYLRNRIN